MSTDQPPDGELPSDLTELLPEESVLSLSEYLDMHATVGHRTRYEILYRLVHGGEASPTELVDAMEIDDSTLHYTSTRSSTSASLKNESAPTAARTAYIPTIGRPSSAR